jgi:acetyltransferase-like isoleucine patch superfamily enzyme
MIKENVVHHFADEDTKTGANGSFYCNEIVWLNHWGITLDGKVGFNHGCYVNGYGGITIGDGTTFGPYCTIHSANHKVKNQLAINTQGWDEKSVTIGKDCWIGMNVTICPGATIGDGVVVGAGSVVTGTLEPGGIYAGNPARFIKARS